MRGKSPRNRRRARCLPWLAVSISAFGHLGPASVRASEGESRTGSYYQTVGSRDVGHIYVREHENGCVRIEIFGDAGAQGRNRGYLSAAARMSGDTLVLSPNDLEACRLTLTFEQSKVTIERVASDSECGPASSVVVAGQYLRRSGEDPEFDFDSSVSDSCELERP
jgi:hypothetical protein